jgi:hypothetical protein
MNDGLIDFHLTHTVSLNMNDLLVFLINLLQLKKNFGNLDS